MLSSRVAGQGHREQGKNAGERDDEGTIAEKLGQRLDFHEIGTDADTGCWRNDTDSSARSTQVVRQMEASEYDEEDNSDPADRQPIDRPSR